MCFRRALPAASAVTELPQTRETSRAFERLGGEELIFFVTFVPFVVNLAQEP